MTVIASFFVPGEPKGQPRPRAFARKIGGKFVARVYEGGSAEGWKGAVALAARPFVQETPHEGPLFLNISLLFPRPARLKRKIDPSGTVPHVSKPDIDNAAKAIMDALCQIGIFRDDAQVAELIIRKRYHEKAGRPGAHVVIGTLSGGFEALTTTVEDALAALDAKIEEVTVAR